MLATHKVLFTRKNNENADTALYPVGLFVDGSVDLSATGSFCVNSGWDALVSRPLYEVVEVTLPEWLSVEEWVGNVVAWKFAWGAGLEVDCGDEMFARFVAYKCRGGAERLAVVKLWKTKAFRSAFRASLCSQLVTWLHDPAPRYDSPFSHKQWASLIGPYGRRDGERLDNSLYHAGRYV